MSDEAREEALSRYSHANVRDRYDADLLMAGFADGAAWQAERDAERIRKLEAEVRAEALREIREAWTNAGPAPAYHRAAQDRLRVEWPTLAEAIEEAIDAGA